LFCTTGTASLPDIGSVAAGKLEIFTAGIKSVLTRET